MKSPDVMVPAVHDSSLDMADQKARWMRLLKGDYTRLIKLGVEQLSFPPVHLPKEINGKTVDLIKVGWLGDEKNPKGAYVHLWLNEGKKGQQKIQFSILANGTLSGEIPGYAASSITQEEVMREVLERFEAINADRWFTLSREVLPPGEMNRTGAGKEPPKPFKRPDIDPRRVSFYSEQEEALLRLTSPGRGGFRGYLIIVYPGFVLLDNVTENNAAYFIDGTPEKIDLPINASDEEVEEIIFNLPFAEWLRKPRMELRRAGMSSLYHHGDAWEIKLKEMIDRRLAKHEQKKME